MLYKNIVVPYDTSEPAKHALATAIELGAGAGVPAKVTAFRVMHPYKRPDSTLQVAAEMAGVTLLDNDARDAVDQYYAKLSKEQVNEQIENFFAELPSNVTINIELGHGRPAEAILDYVRDNKCDCIVMGSRGLGAVKSAFGSVSTAVLREATVPVLIVR